MFSASLQDAIRDGRAARDNNFNLLRLGAALLVVLSHSILLTGDLGNGFAWRIGYLAVNCFFVISGFLVCASLLSRGPTLSFVRARLLRIFPALIVVVSCTVFGLGLLISTEPAMDYLGSSQTWIHWFRNSILVAGDIVLALPGVFENNPMSRQVNAPLWTLQYELLMYAGLLAVFRLCLLGGKARAQGLFKGCVTAVTLIATVAFLANVASPSPGTGQLAHIVRFSAMFGAGACLYLFRDRVRLSFAVCVVLLILAALSSLWRPMFVVVVWLSLPYVLLCLAYLPRGPVLLFNKLGDYSYGTYIIAFPVQQTLVYFNQGMEPLTLFVTTLLITLPLAALSWHFIEQPALGRKPAQHRA